MTWPADHGPAPAFATPRTPGRQTFGGVAAAIAEGLGRPFMPWQRYVADVSLEIVPDPEQDQGWSWAYDVVTLGVQRQAGKTTLTFPVQLSECLRREDAAVWFTQQTRQDARDTFVDAFTKQLARGPLAEVAKVRLSNGSEGVSFPNRSQFRIFAPTAEALHSKAVHRAIVDECWAFDPERGSELEGAIIPTFTTTGGQLWLVSAGGAATSAWWRSKVATGRAAVLAGRTRGHAHFEWQLPDEHHAEVESGLEAGKLDPDSPALTRALELVYRFHPAAGRTMRGLGVLRQAAGVMRPGEFMRAYANRWTEAAERIVPAADWSHARQPDWPEPAVPVALAVDVDLDGAGAAVVAAWRDTPASPMRWHVLDARPGTGWVADRVAQLVRDRRPLAVAHYGGPALDVADQVRRALPDHLADLVQLVRTPDYAGACSGVLAALTERPGRLHHAGQPELDAAVEVAARRWIGDGAWSWVRRDSAGSIAPLVAGTCAGWAYDHAPKQLAAPMVVTRRRPSLAGIP